MAIPAESASPAQGSAAKLAGKIFREEWAMRGGIEGGEGELLALIIAKMNTVGLTADEKLRVTGRVEMLFEQKQISEQCRREVLMLLGPENGESNDNARRDAAEK